MTHIAYALLSCGCSLIEGADDSADEAENLGILERAGKLLSDAYRYNDSEADEKIITCLLQVWLSTLPSNIRALLLY